MNQQSACGATFDHDWHGFRSNDGMHQVCDGKPRAIPSDGGLPPCEGWTCQSCGADNFIPHGFARVIPSSKGA